MSITDTQLNQWLRLARWESDDNDGFGPLWFIRAVEELVKEVRNLRDEVDTAQRVEKAALSMADTYLRQSEKAAAASDRYKDECKRYKVVARAARRLITGRSNGALIDALTALNQQENK